nr:Uroporphyrinogen-III C-methyltransferase [uncultured bacterium]
MIPRTNSTADILPPGSVALVGAGPGDPDLLTLGAVKILGAADVVVYDALVSEAVLDHLASGCERIFVGKRGGHPSVHQTEISATLVTLAKAGRRVARLKGGDPFIFGRGGEEACCLAREKIPFRIVPGVTAGIAGPAYAGIPLTHRGINSNVGFFTGHESAETSSQGGEDSPFSQDWAAIGRTFPVLVLYMAMKHLPEITQGIMAGGRRADTPVAVIRWATTPEQTTLVTTLGRVVADVAAHGLKPPAIVVIGEVVGFRETLRWRLDRDPRVTVSQD